MQTLQSSLKKHWMFVVSKKKKDFYGILESILESYLKLDLGPLALISVMFINIAIII